MGQSTLNILPSAVLIFANVCLGFSMWFLRCSDTPVVTERIPPPVLFSHTLQAIAWSCLFPSQLSIRLLVLATGKDRESLQSWTDSPRIKFLLDTHGRKEQIESLKKMEIDGAFALEISQCNRCLLCHPHLNQRPWSASHAHSCQDLACLCLPSQHVPWVVHGPMSVVGGSVPFSSFSWEWC